MNPTGGTEPRLVQAEVRAGNTVIPYHRAGAGRPVIVLLSAQAENGAWTALVIQVAGGCRVILPAIAPSGPGADPADWFPNFLDGLGLESVALVAVPSAQGLAVRLAATGDGRVSHLVLLSTGRHRWPSPAGDAIPALVLPAGAEPAATAAAILAFVGATPPPG